MKLIEIERDLYLIPLDQALPGFTDFIGAWLYKGEKTLLIDVGPAATVPVLLKALAHLNLQRLDAILLTHIHIDHAGGVGALVKRFPNTPVVCHGSGIPHLKDPSRLWEGSLKTLKAVAESYGPIAPVPAERLQDAAEFQAYGIVPILTPGHAPHHVSYQIGNYLFAGEAGGVFSNLSGKDKWYLRPATPPKFFLETSIQSLEDLINIPHTHLCYGHFGATRHTPGLLKAHKSQLYLWAAVIEEQMKQYEGESLIEQSLKALLERDPELSEWHQLKPAVRQRERGFLYNSIRGFAGYLGRADAH